MFLALAYLDLPITIGCRAALVLIYNVQANIFEQNNSLYASNP